MNSVNFSKRIARLGLRLGGYVLMVSLVFTSCTKKYDDSALWAEVNSQKEALQSLQQAVKDADYITSVEELTEGAGGYKITFMSGKVITVMNGADGADGADGQNGSNATGDNVFAPDGVDNSNEDYVKFTLVDGSEIVVLRYKGVNVKFAQPDGFGASDNKKVGFKLEGGAKTVKVLDVPADWRVTVTMDPVKADSGWFTIVAPATFNSTNSRGEAVVLASDGGERTVMRSLQFSIGIKSLAITASPSPKANYGIGESFDINSIVVTATLADDSKQVMTITDENLSYDFSEAGQKPVTVSMYGQSATYDVTVLTLTQRIRAIDVNSPVTITLYANETIAPTTIGATKAVRLITLAGGISQRSSKRLSLSGTGSMFTISAGSSLTLSNVGLVGLKDNTAPLVTVEGTFTMNAGTGIANNNNSSNSNRGGGVRVNSGGLFNMGSGSIIGCYALQGGGVYIAPGGEMSMLTQRIAEAPTITRNRSEYSGGGVAVVGTLTMETGTITGNTRGSQASENTDLSAIGKDVYVAYNNNSEYGTLKMKATATIGNVLLSSITGGQHSTITINGAITTGGVSAIDLDAYAETLDDAKQQWVNENVLTPSGVSLTRTMVEQFGLARLWLWDCRESMSMKDARYSIGTNGKLNQ